MTDDDLDRIEALCEQATPGPWAFRDYRPDYNRGAEPYGVEGEYQVAAVWESPDDARLIATARTAIPALVAEVRKVRAAITAHRDGFLATLDMADHTERDLRRGDLDHALWAALPGDA